MRLAAAACALAIVIVLGIFGAVLAQKLMAPPQAVASAPAVTPTIQPAAVVPAVTPEPVHQTAPAAPTVPAVSGPSQSFAQAPAAAAPHPATPAPAAPAPAPAPAAS